MRDEQQFKDLNPVEIIHQNKANIDLPSYDLLFDRFVSGDWGKTKPRNPTQIAQKAIEFMGCTQELGIALSKE